MRNPFKRSPGETRADPSLSLDQWLSYFSFNGVSYPYGLGLNQTLGGQVEEVAANFTGYVEMAYRSNGVVFACMMARLLLFTEARFQFRAVSNGRPGRLFGTGELGPLETPWPNGTTGDLLAKAIQDADLAGNFYATRRPDSTIKRLRPDWVSIIVGGQGDAEAGDVDQEVVGYVYHPGGKNSGKEPVTLLPEQVAHWAPIPDPVASFRGMSWLTPVIREAMADQAATSHKLKFFENGATPNMVVKLDPEIQQEAFERWIELFRQNHEGVANAYRTLYLGGGADAQVVGSNMEQLDFKVTQGHGETRIAAAARVPPIIVGLSEGLDAATYSNYGQARRAFTDHTMRPLWRGIAGKLATIINVPGGSELWYDDRDIPFLQEDQKDAAEIQSTQAQSIEALIRSGFEPDSAIQAVMAGDFSKLIHTGMLSVQLQPIGSVGEGKGALVSGVPVPTNGSGNGNGAGAPAEGG